MSAESWSWKGKKHDWNYWLCSGCTDREIGYYRNQAQRLATCSWYITLCICRCFYPNWLILIAIHFISNVFPGNQTHAEQEHMLSLLLKWWRRFETLFHLSIYQKWLFNQKEKIVCNYNTDYTSDFCSYNNRCIINQSPYGWLAAECFCRRVDELWIKQTDARFIWDRLVIRNIIFCYWNKKNIVD